MFPIITPVTIIETWTFQWKSHNKNIFARHLPNYLVPETSRHVHPGASTALLSGVLKGRQNGAIDYCLNVGRRVYHVVVLSSRLSN